LSLVWSVAIDVLVLVLFRFRPPPEPEPGRRSRPSSACIRRSTAYSVTDWRGGAAAGRRSAGYWFRHRFVALFALVGWAFRPVAADYLRFRRGDL